MSLFGEILQSLNESVDVNAVNDAINKRYEVVMTYHSKGEDKNTGQRLIQPVAYGTTKAGYPVIRAYQPYGDTTTKTPSWKFFRLDRIGEWRPLTMHTFNQPPGASKEALLGSFNPNGDETMSQVYNIANFGGGKQIKSVTPEKNISGPVTKNDVVNRNGNTQTKQQSLQQAPTGPVSKQDVKNANEPEIPKSGQTNQSNTERLAKKLSDRDYLSQAMTDAEYWADDNEEQENI